MSDAILEQTIAELEFMKRDVLEGSDKDMTLNKALALLKEREAVKPVEEFVKGANRHDYHCKRCGNIVGSIFDDKHPIFPGAKSFIKHFCDVCGQAVKWDD